MDTRIKKLIKREEARQSLGLELIPSENYVSKDVKKALGSCFTNKYSEGYPGARYYGGQENTDLVENIAIDRACKLFNAKFANVQPHSGAPANIATYFALASPGDTILGMELSHGGHLTHGHPVTSIAKIFRFIRYGIKDIKTGEIDYEALRELAQKEKPKIILAGFSSYPRELNYKKFVEISREVGAIAVADMSHIAGLIAGKVVRNPFDDGFDIITTTTHKTLRGPRGGIILVRESEDLIKKINKAVFPGLQGGPHMNTVAAKAICFGEALKPEFHAYAQQILKNAKVMEEVFRNHKICMITGGTDNHLILIDILKSLRITGKEAQIILDEVGITVNMNIIPNDPAHPLNPSGIRLGTPAITTRGLKEKECFQVAEILIETLKNKENEEKKNKIKEKIKNLCKNFPIPETF